MDFQQKESMRKKSPLFLLFIALPFLAMLFALAFAFWLRSLSGVRGLLEWMPSYRLIYHFIQLTGFIPLLFLGLYILLTRKNKRISALIIRLCTVIFSVAVIAAMTGGALYLSKLMHALPSGIPALNRYDAASGKPLIRLAFSSDPHIGNAASRPDITAKILETVNEGGYDAFFLLGDIAEIGVPGSAFKTAAELFAQKLTQVPLVTLMGNHDALIGGEYLYRKIFNPDLYFRIDSGTVHILALNLLWGEDTFDKAQKDWLIATLASIPPPDTTIVISHSFIRASGYVDHDTGKDWYDQSALISNLAPILEKGGVDLVISGHNHFMEYLEKQGNGTAYAVVGAMGGKSEPERSYTSEWSSWYEGNQFGFLDLDLYEGHMKLTFRDETGKELHTILR